MCSIVRILQLLLFFEGNCLKFSLFRYRIWSINQYTNIALAKPAAEDICTTITTIDGSADGERESMRLIPYIL